MKSLRTLFWSVASCIVAVLLGVPAGGQARPTPTQTTPPVAPVRNVVDDYYGTSISDPYRYMEDLQSPEVQAWFKGQNDHTRGVLARIPGRQTLLERIAQLDNAATARVYDVRRLPSDRYFYQKRFATEDVGKLYFRDGLAGQERLVVDPVKIGATGAPAHSINYYAPSFDGAYVAYGESAGGSEDAVIHIVQTATGRETGETIDRGWFASPAWLPDGRAFFHNRMQKMEPGMPGTERELKSKVYLHVVGTDPEKDPLVFGYGVSPAISMEQSDFPFVATFPGSSYALGVVAHGTDNEVTLYAAPLSTLGATDIPWRKIADKSDAVTDFAPVGDNIYLLTHQNASRYKVVRTSLTQPDFAHAEVVIPEGSAVLRGLALAQDAIYAQLLDGGIGGFRRVPLAGAAAGNSQLLPLPLEGSVAIAASDPRVPGILIDLTTWTKAQSIYAFDPQTNRTSDIGLAPHGPFDNPTDLVSEEVKVRSYDGTMVPLSIVYRRGLKRDGSNPTLLDGYGSYGITLDPFFDPRLLAWYERGGVFAVAHVRGGGEYGEDWHLAGRMLTKHNTWRDFIAAAQYLVDHKYTSPAHLSGDGASAGGITIGRAITDRPDLFAAAIDEVGVTDALRAETSPNGPPNVMEFGSTKTHEGFNGLYEMSSYHQVKDGTAYPAVLIVTGINDPRVAPWEPGKMAARLQAATSSGKPILLRVDYEAGHGFGSTKSQQEQLLADEMSFMLWQFGVPGFQPSP